MTVIRRSDGPLDTWSDFRTVENMEIEARQELTAKSVLVMFVLPVVFVAIGLWMVLAADSSSFQRVIGWASIIFFGVGGAVMAGRFLFGDRGVLLVDDAGISGAGRLGQARWSVPWSRIDAVYAVTQHVPGSSVEHVAVSVLDDPAEESSAMARMTGDLVGVPTSATGRIASWQPGVRPPVDDVLAAVATRGVTVVDLR
ncbi:STM3941 family protein [Gordonia neofelifaecis]|uniref:PH domain-containing protein n=1 Tax=Gordonia neofelifaecis NRRL B-59395 TaxID=644548 RepID=F1YET1_9ACTN|nr:STM3941 family protein [Gordonia neofelifaecis]EGD56914.1 hypothetical protein SCNU_01010 [Gordonia neofelifaecis NRRL B-59395]